MATVENKGKRGDEGSYRLAAHKAYMAEFKAAAEAVEATLPPGHRVTYGKAWKGYSVTVWLPKRELPKRE